MKEMPPSWVGRLLAARYRVESLLRHDEISSLYHAIDKRTKRPVLINLIHPNLSQQPTFAAHFQQALSAVAKLRHPMILPLSDFACTEEACYIVLPHVPGDTLAQRLTSLNTAHLRLPFDDTIEIMSKLCEAMSYAHEQNIVHGGLNPSHVIIDLGGEPVVTHFGMAKLFTNHTLPQGMMTMNTVTYMSPEQIRGQPADRRADIYALGVILYEMMAGHPPFEGDSITAVIEKHLHEPVPDIRLFDRHPHSNNNHNHNHNHNHNRSGIPYGMMTVLQKALAKDPDERFWSAREMAGALQMMSLKTIILPENELEYASSMAKQAPLATTPEPTPAKTGPSARFASGLLRSIILCMLLLLTALSILSYLWMQESVSLIFATTPQPVVPSPVAPSPVAPSPVATSTTQAESAQPTVENKLVTSQNMVNVAGGRYLVGQEAGIEVDISDFWIDQYEVSNAKYAEFVAEAAAIAPASWQNKQIPAKMANHPVQNVSWEAASAYCAWVNKRLPSEIEWEVAARGPYSWRFPWGNEEEMVTLPKQESYPVGSVLENRSFFGGFDMAGNAAEWVDAPYLSQTAEDEDKDEDKNEDKDEDKDEDEGRVLRGGESNTQEALMGRLSGEEAQSSVARAGFRCASSHVEPEPEASILLHDDFRDLSSGWWQADAPIEGYFYGYDAPDVYQIGLSNANSCLSVHHEMPTDHIMIETELFLANSEAIKANMRYGVTLRATNNNFYAFVLSPDNQGWQVLKSTAEGFLLMDEGSSDTITGIKEEISDKLLVIANYSEFAFFVNGELVSRVHDNEYHSGRIGFMLQTFDQPATQIHVDSVTVRALPTHTQRSAVIDTSPTPYALNSPICEGSVLDNNRLTRFISHRVRRGQNLNKIARRYGVPMTDILSANGIKDPNLIKRGQILIIPQYE